VVAHPASLSRFLRTIGYTVKKTLMANEIGREDMALLYSPDLNPIEMAFAKLKSHLMRIGARTIDDPGRPSAASTTSTRQTNAGITSMQPFMHQIKHSKLV